jgi:hypothetical protein
MSKRLLSYDPITKTAEYHYYDHSSKKTYIKQEQDCSAIIENNKRLQNSHNTSQFLKKDNFHHIASVPNTVLLDWRKKYGIDWNRKEDLPKLEKLLKSNEYRYLRTVDKI